MDEERKRFATKEKVKDIISSFSEIAGSLNDADTFARIGINSLRLVELVVAIEEEFSINFDDSILEPSRIVTVKDMCDLVNEYVS